MPNVKLYDMQGKEKGEIALNDSFFGIEVNKAVLHAAVRAYLLNQRQGTQSTLTRAEVSGGGIKPWRQKGTGRARQGSIRSPQWTHGGIALGPKPRSYRVSLNKKVKKLALKSALSAKAQDNEIVVIENLVAEEYKTRTMVDMLKAIGLTKKVLVILPTADQKLIKSFANIPTVKTTIASSLNAYDVLNNTCLVIAKESLEVIEEVYA